MQKTAGWAFPAQLLWKGFCSFEMKGKKKKKKNPNAVFKKPSKIHFTIIGSTKEHFGKGGLAHGLIGP
jgi:hypothetical protein